MTSTPLRIGGRQVDSGVVEDVLNPFDGTVVGRVCLGNEQDMEVAIKVAAESFDRVRRLPTHEKANILERTAGLIAARADRLASLMVRESGKPIRFCRGEVARARMTFRLAASAALDRRGETMPADIEARGEGRLLLYNRVPRGPIAAISPFNFPLNLIAHKLAPALAIGAPTVLKPPPQCPLTAFELADILDEAGMPPEALSVIHCQPAVAQRMVEDDRMKVLSFTGSAAVGWKLKALAGKKQVLLELGGNAPCVIDESADLDALMGPVVAGAWANAGQVCIKVQRILVHESLFDRFLSRFIAETKALGVGDPMSEATVVGPLIEPHHVDRVLSWVQEAVTGGARMHTGGQANGNVVAPTILTDVPSDALVCKEEVFGPVTLVERFETFDEALQRCNRTRYGLQAGVFTADLGRAMKAYDTLEYGGVMINDVPTFRVDNFPYGGTKDSGFGREGVRFAMEEMTEPKVMVIRGL